MADDDLIEAMRALAHPLRWRILTVLGSDERNVSDIEAATGIGQPGLSQQLGVLRKAALVSTRKEAKLVFYSIAGDRISAVTRALAALAPGLDVTVDAPAAPRASGPQGVATFARVF